MNAYPPELRTPPLPLVAFVGLPECHKEVGAYFSQTLRPPLVSVGVAEANEHVLARLFGPRKNPSLSLGPPVGILKADWFVKHRQRKAAVAIAFANRYDVEGDPNAWNKLLFQLRIVREATSARAAGFIVVVLQDYSAPDLPADRSTAICQHLNLEARSILSLTKVDMAAAEASQARHDEDLKAIGKMVVEQAIAYYTNETARIKQKLSDRTALNGTCPVEVSCRTAFKLGVLCEFRQDWGGAVSQYQAAYQQLSELARSQPWSWQRHAEVTRVAEQVQFKICMLLLHQQRLDQALDQFRNHMGTYLNPPVDPIPPAALSSHLAWVARQYAAAAEMIRPRMQECAPEQQDCHPAYLHLAAADTAIRRRLAAVKAHAARPPQPLIHAAAVKKGAFVGQLLLRTEDGTRPLTEPEYLAYLEVEESKVNHSQLSLELLNASLMHFKEPRHERMRSYVGVLMAQEHLAASNLQPAYKLLLQVAHAYRRDGWDSALVSVLMRLCECAKRLKLAREYVSYSLEVTALPNQLGNSVNCAVATEAINSMLTGTHNIKTSIMKKSADLSRRSTVDEGQEASAAGSPPAAGAPPSAGFHYIVEHLELKTAQKRWRDKDGTGNRAGVADLMQKHHQQDSGWWRCIALAAGFDTQPSDPNFMDYCLVLHSHVPVKVPVECVEVRFQDDKGQCVLSAVPDVPSDSTPVQKIRGAPRSQSASLQSATSAGSATSSVLEERASIRSEGALSTSGRLEDGVSAELYPGGAAEERSSLEASSSGKPGALESLGVLSFELLPFTWTHLCVRVQPRQLGKIKVDQVCIHLSKHGSVTYRLNTFPAGQTLPWRLQQELPFFRHLPSVQLGHHTFQVQHVGPLPQLDVRWPDLCLAGEFVRVELTISVQQPLLKAELDVALKPLEGLSVSLLTMQREEDGALINMKCEGERFAVPPVTPSSPCCLYLWLRASQPGRVSLSTSLLCPAAVSRTNQLELLPAFHYSSRFHAEANVHTLALPSRAPAPTTGAPLTIGQPCLLLVNITASQPISLELVGAYMEMEADSGLQLMGDLQQQLRSAAGSCIKKGDTYSLLLHACPTKVAPAVSMGTMHLRWKRSKEEQGGTGGARSSDSSIAELTHQDVIDTPLELPVVWVSEGILSVRVVSPAHATSGIGFNFTLQLHNFTNLPQELVVAITDPQGFVVNGERRQHLTVPAREKSNLVWLLVSQSSGQQPLPSVRVVSVRHNCAVVTSSTHVHILPF